MSYHCQNAKTVSISLNLAWVIVHDTLFEHGTALQCFAKPFIAELRLQGMHLQPQQLQMMLSLAVVRGILKQRMCALNRWDLGLARFNWACFASTFKGTGSYHKLHRLLCYDHQDRICHQSQCSPEIQSKCAEQCSSFTCFLVCGLCLAGWWIYRSLQKPTRLPNPTLFEHVVTCGKRRDKEFCSSQCSVLNVPLSQSLSQLLLVENDSMGLHRREYPLLCSLLKRTKRICCGGFCSREKASPAVQWYLQLTSVVSHE